MKKEFDVGHLKFFICHLELRVFFKFRGCSRVGHLLKRPDINDK